MPARAPLTDQEQGINNEHQGRNNNEGPTQVADGGGGLGGSALE